MSVVERIDAEGTPSPEESVHEVAPHSGFPAPRRGYVLLAVIALVALVAAALVATRDEAETPVRPGASTTIAPAPTTTLAPPTTAAPTTTPTTVPVDTTTAVFPSAGSVGYDDPVAAARAFAVDFVGFVGPVMSGFRHGDNNSGEVDVRPSPSGPVTTVIVRRLGETWWVLGSTTANIDLRTPAALATISSPVHLAGVSTAFEANVGVEIRQDGARRPVGESYVMGGSMGDLGPFDGWIPFMPPSSPMGAIMLSTASMENGNVWEATVVRVSFAGTTVLVPSRACPDYFMERPVAAEGQMVVTVYFMCGLDEPPVPSYRLVTKTAGVLRAALEALLAGPTVGEAGAGLESWFSSATGDLLDDVAITDGHAVVDLHDPRQIIPNASTSAGSHVLLEQLDATVFQFPSVSSVIYRIEGDCAAFSEWLQYGGCDVRTRAL